MIRTHWKYTEWVKISFSLFAEDRSDIEAGYYQVDSGILGGCESGKNLQTFLAFKNESITGGIIHHHVFLQGF